MWPVLKLFVYSKFIKDEFKQAFQHCDNASCVVSKFCSKLTLCAPKTLCALWGTFWSYGKLQYFGHISKDLG